MPEGIIITDAGLNANSNGYESETTHFDATIENNSTTAINNITLTLSSISSALTLTDATETVATIAGGQVLDLASIFAGQIGEVADGTIINCTVIADYLLDGVPTQQTYTFSFIAHAGWADDISHNVEITVGNGDNEINPTETIEVTITTENPGLVNLANISSTLTSNSPHVTITNANQTITNIAANGTATTVFTIDIAASTPDNTTISFLHTADAGVHGTDNYSFTITVLEAAVVNLNDVNHNYTIVTGNGDADVNPGETIQVSVYTRNDGRADAHNAVSTLTCDSQYATIGNATQAIGTIAGYAVANTQFSVLIDTDTPDETVLTFTHVMTSDEDTCSVEFTVTVIEFNGFITFVESSHTVSIISGNNDNDINPSETIRVTVYSRNDGNIAAANVASTLMSTSGYASITSPVVNFQAAIPGATLTSQYDVVIDAQTPDQTVIPFTHLITDGTNTASYEFEIQVIALVGINENGETGLITVYPNPTEGTTHISCTYPEANSLKVYDVYGKMVKSQAITEETTELNLSQCANGLYFVRIFSSENVLGTVKVIKR